jgi:valyl-tRNA synthetase
MDSRYEHAQHETDIYQLWEKSGAFAPPATKTGKKSFCIIMPPPNANDPLHVGHAMFVSLEDVMIRFHRMLGEDTLWLPGTDHAGIETQFVFEKKLKKEGKSRFQFDRETLFKMIWDYVQQNSGTAVDQMKKLGASADWSRFTFMLDPNVVTSALKTFEKLHADHLVYRDMKLVNYCTKCGTAFSELEVKHTETKSPLYYMKYGPFTLATTRPETKFGDTAIAVNPQDKRYQQYIGQEVEAEGLLGKFKIKVIADDYVDPEFGTGVVKITPAHDFNDYEVWQRHKAEIPGPKQVIGFDGKLNELAGPYQGLKVAEARARVATDLETNGWLVKTDQNYVNNVGTCYRCGTVIEPLPLPQFFIQVKPLTEKALAALDKNQVKVHGAGHDKILKHWLMNLKDWNISRQIVWGIRLPVWYDVDKNPDLEVIFLDKSNAKQNGKIGSFLAQGFSLTEINHGLQSLKAPMSAQFEVSLTQPGENFIQETDTFDTWFSSGQWPINTLKNTRPNDFERFYPTTVMETAYDILPFWVMRMLMFGLYLTDQVPFEHVYFHGLIRDAKGQKMSKSKGNVVNPLEIVEKYGSDALRMALIIRSSPGLDKSVSEPDFKAMRNLTNKIWNATRFCLILNEDADKKSSDQNNSVSSTEFTKHLNQTVQDITQQLADYKPGMAAETTYNEFWHWFCDQCIEQAKSGELSLTDLNRGLITFLKLLHPFAPFITEAAWQELIAANLVKDEKLLISSAWPSII